MTPRLVQAVRRRRAVPIIAGAAAAVGLLAVAFGRGEASCRSEPDRLRFDGIYQSEVRTTTDFMHRHTSRKFLWFLRDGTFLSVSSVWRDDARTESVVAGFQLLWNTPTPRGRYTLRGTHVELDSVDDGNHLRASGGLTNGQLVLHGTVTTRFGGVVPYDHTFTFFEARLPETVPLPRHEATPGGAAAAPNANP